MSVFVELGAFVAAQSPRGDITADVGGETDAGYSLHVAGECGALFERWITPDIAVDDLPRSPLTAFVRLTGLCP